MFNISIHWLIKQITNTYRNHFSRSYESSNCIPKITDEELGPYRSARMPNFFFKKLCFYFLLQITQKPFMQKSKWHTHLPYKVTSRNFRSARSPFECIIHYKFPGYTVLQSIYSHKRILKVHQ